MSNEYNKQQELLTSKIAELQAEVEKLKSLLSISENKNRLRTAEILNKKYPYNGE